MRITVRSKPLCFLLLCIPTCAAQTGQLGKSTVVSFKAQVDEPVYVGEPVWVRTEPKPNIRYPFHDSIGDFGCNRLELTHNGRPVPPRPPQSFGDGSGIQCGSAAPHNSPENRLPLHVWFPFEHPGVYAVRWIHETPDFKDGRPHFKDGKPQTDAISSEWTTFRVHQTSPSDRDAWLTRLLSNPPTDYGLLAGDFLPSLAAAAPNQRALSAFLDYLYSDNEVVAREAASALELFPQPEVMRAVVSLIDERGPNEQLAFYATYHNGWTSADEAKVVHAAARHLTPSATPQNASDRPHGIRQQPRRHSSSSVSFSIPRTTLGHRTRN